MCTLSVVLKLTCVYPHVYFEGLSLSEASLAHSTRVWFASCVYPLVIAHTGCPLEHAATRITVVRLDIGVRTLVAFQTDPESNSKLEALRERRPPWPWQIITPILPTVKMLSLGGERLPPPKKKKKKFWLITCTTIWVCNHYYGVFAHLLILYPDHHQNLISSSLYYPRPLHKISSQSVHNFLSNVVHRQTDKQTNQRYQKHNLLCQGGNNDRTRPWCLWF